MSVSYGTTQLAKLSFNRPSVVLTADVFQYIYIYYTIFYKIAQDTQHHNKSLNVKAGY